MIHRYWHGGPPPESTPNVETLDWTDDTLRADVVAWLDAAQGKVRASDQLRHRSNMVRVWLLHELGGVWIDYDITVHEPIEQWRRPFAAAHGGLCNCVLGFDAGHPMLAEALEVIDAAPDDPHGWSVEVSGELMLHRIRTPDVELVQLPRDRLGRPLEGGRPWVVHRYASTR